MQILDAFTPDLPEHLVGAFDIVHIRTIFSAVRNNAVEPLLQNLVKMLSELLRTFQTVVFAWCPSTAATPCSAFVTRSAISVHVFSLLTLPPIQNQADTSNGTRVILLQLKHARQILASQRLRARSLLDCLPIFPRPTGWRPSKAPVLTSSHSSGLAGHLPHSWTESCTDQETIVVGSTGFH
jgi:hypothetical protein